MAGSLGTAVIRVVANTAGVAAGLGAASGMLIAFGTSVRAAAASMRTAATEAAVLGAALIAALSPMVIWGAKFEYSMSTVKGVISELRAPTEEAAQAFERLEKKAMDLGRTTMFTAGQVADAMANLGRAGFTAEEVLSGIGPVLNLAAAGQLELARASEISATVMRAFKIDAENLGRVADVLVAASNESNTTVNLLGESFKYAAPLASALGQRVEDVAAGLALLAQSGMRGSIAGTGFAQVMNKLTKPTKGMENVLGRLGMTFDQVDASMNNVIDTVILFKKANADAIDIMEAFDIRGGRAMLAMMNNSEDAINAMRDNMNASFGDAAEMAAVQMGNIKGSFLELKSAFESVNITVFRMIQQELKTLLVTVTENIRAFQLWAERSPEAAEQLIGSIVKITALVGGLATGFAAVGIPLSIAMKLFGDLSIVVGSVFSVLSSPVWGPIVVAALAAVALGTTIAVKAWDSLMAAVNAGYNNIIKPFLTGLAEGFMWAWQAVEFILDAMAAAFAELWDTLAELYTAMAPLMPLFKWLGRIIGAIVVAPLIIALAALYGQFKLITTVIGWVAKGLTWLGRKLGILNEAVDDTEESISALEQAMAAQEQVNKDLVVHTKKYLEALKLQNQEMSEFGTLTNNMSELNRQQRDRLIELTKTRLADADAQEVGIQKTRDALAAVEKQIEESDSLGVATGDLVIEKKRLQEVLGAQIRNLKNFKEAMIAAKEAGYDPTVEGVRAWAEELTRLETVIEGALSATKRLKDSQEAFAEMQEKLRNGTKTAIEEETDAINELHDANKELIETRVKDMELQRLLLKERGQSTDELDKEIEKTKEWLKLNEEKRKQALQDQKDKLKAKQDELQAEQEADLLEEQGDTVGAAEAREKARMARRKEELKELFDLETAEGQAAYEEAVRREEQLSQLKMDNMRADHAEQEAKAEERAKKARQRERKKAEDKQVNAGLEHQRDMELEIIKGLAKKASSIRDLIMLYRVMFKLQEEREIRARKQHDNVAKAEQKVINLRKKIDNAQSLEEKQRLQDKLEQAKKDLDFEKRLGRVRDGEAGADGAGAVDDQDDVGEAQDVLDKINVLDTKIQQALEKIELVFVQAPEKWLETLVSMFEVDWWQVEDKMKEALDHFKSEVEIWADDVNNIFVHLLDSVTDHLAALQLKIDLACQGQQRLAECCCSGGGGGGDGSSGGDQTTNNTQNNTYNYPNAASSGSLPPQYG